MTDKVENEVIDEKVEDKAVEKTDGEQHDEVVLTDVEQQATSFGWKAKDQWVKDGGAEEDWVPAKHFMKFGEVKQQLISKDKELAKRDKLVKMMKDHHLNVRRQAYDDAMRSIKSQRKAALEENDLVQAEILKDKIEDLNSDYLRTKDVLPREVDEEIKQLEQEKQAVPEVNPDFPSWHAKNPWYILEKGKQDAMSKEADILAAAEVMAAKNEDRYITANEVYQTVEKKIKKLYAEKFNTPKSPQSDSPGKTSGKSTSASPKLNEEELAVAKAFGLTPEKYAEQTKTYRGR